MYYITNIVYAPIFFAGYSDPVVQNALYINNVYSSYNNAVLHQHMYNLNISELYRLTIYLSNKLFA